MTSRRGTYTLALDTAGPVASLALSSEEGLLAERSAEVGPRSSETLLPALRRLVSEVGRLPSDLGAVVVGSGPGSYTGLRIAAAAAKGVTHALTLPLFAYDSLEAMSAGAAQAAGTAALPPALLPLLPARRDEVFAACHATNGDVLEPSALVSPAEAAVWAGEHEAVAIGPGAERHAAELREAGVRVVSELGAHAAAGLLRLHESHGDIGRVADPDTWEPRYLRATPEAVGGAAG